MRVVHATVDIGDGWELKLEKLVHTEQDNSSLRLEVMKALEKIGLEIENYNVNVREAE
jgi:hypothetical protein